MLYKVGIALSIIVNVNYSYKICKVVSYKTLTTFFNKMNLSQSHDNNK